MMRGVRMLDLRGYSHPSMKNGGPAILRGYRAEAMREAMQRIINRAPMHRKVYCASRGFSSALRVVSYATPGINDNSRNPLRMRLAAGTNAWERALFGPL